MSIRTLIFAVGLPAILAACAPNVWQGYNAAPSDDTKPAYYINGFTGLGELTEADAKYQAQRFGNYLCKPDAARVERVDTRPAANGWGDYLRWTAKAQCQ